MTDFGALTVKGDATLEGEVDSLSTKGTGTITSQTIPARGTYTETIALGDTYEDGVMFITPSLTGTMGVSYGNMVFLNTSTAFAAGAEVYADFYTRLAGWHSQVSGSRYGTDIRLYNAYIDGTDLVLEFFNISYSLSAPMNAKYTYSVWKAA